MTKAGDSVEEPWVGGGRAAVVFQQLRVSDTQRDNVRRTKLRWGNVIWEGRGC